MLNYKTKLKNYKLNRGTKVPYLHKWVNNNFVYIWHTEASLFLPHRIIVAVVHGRNNYLEPCVIIAIWLTTELLMYYEYIVHHVLHVYILV